MVRIKFLLFTVIVLGAWAAQIAFTASAQSEAAVNEGRRSAELTTRWAQMKLESDLAVLRGAVLGAVGSPNTLVVAKGPRLPASDRLTQLRDGVVKSFSDADRTLFGADFLFAFAAAEDVAHARGLEGAVETAGLDVAELAKAGPRGMLREVAGVPYVTFAFPIFEQGAPDALGTLVLGAPAFRANALVGASQPVALVAGDKVIATGGLQPGSEGLVQSWLTALGEAPENVVQRGAVAEIGPLKLPALTDGDVMGGKAALGVAVRQPLKPYELIGYASIEATQGALASSQRRAFTLLGALAALGLVWTFLMGGSQAQAKSAAAEEKPAARRAEAKVAPSAAAQPSASAAAEGVEEELAAQPAPAEASPDDFQFGGDAHEGSDATGEAPAPEFNFQPSSEPYSDKTVVEQLSPDSLFAAAPFTPAPIDAEPPSAALEPAPEPPAMEEPAADFPFGSAESAPLPPPPSGYVPEDDDNPDATRVASVPEELLRAAAHAGGPAELMATVRAPSASAPSIAALGNPDDSHFQDVFREFLETRERCGEVADGLTFDKFAAKLRKNKDQLMQKHNCKTVRFQVYVKEGKAALKATPIAR